MIRDKPYHFDLWRQDRPGFRPARPSKGETALERDGAAEKEAAVHILVAAYVTRRAWSHPGSHRPRVSPLPPDHLSESSPRSGWRREACCPHRDSTGTGGGSVVSRKRPARGHRLEWPCRND